MYRRIRFSAQAGRWLKLVQASFFMLLVAACAGAGGSDQGFGFEDNLPLISEARERRVGAREHPRIVAAFGGAYQDQQMQRGLDEIVDRLARVSPRPDIDYQLTVLNTPSVNAFALPGGFLYVTRGLLALSNDRDEIAAVLAHEMGHVSARHAAKRESQASTIAVVGRVAQQALRDPVRAAGAILASRSMFASFSRQQEFEADQIGLETAVQAGFDPYGAATFLDSMREDREHREQLLRQENRSSEASFMASHPSTPDRIAKVLELSGSFGIAEGARPRQRDAFLSLIDGLLFGDDPREGFIRDRTFLHPNLRFAFDVPEGFNLQNSSDAVFVLGPDGSAMRFDGIDIPPRQSLERFVRNVWARGVTVQDMVPGHVGVMDAIFGAARHGGWNYRLAAVRFAPDKVFRFLLAARDIDVSLEDGFRSTVNSLRSLSAEQAAQARPLRIRTVQVGANDNQRSMARRMVIKDNALEQFRILNGLTANSRLTAGQSVKIIAE